VKYAVEIVSGGMTCITSFGKTGTDVQKLLGLGRGVRYTHTHTLGKQGDLISLL
jgi:hypothetical protein